MFDVPDIPSEAFEPCRHLGQRSDGLGQGCTIHGSTPALCKGYLCEWALGNAPQWMKPSECGVVPGHTVGHSAMQLNEVWPGASDSEQVQGFIRESNQRRINVLVMRHPTQAEQASGTEPKNRVYLFNGEVREVEGGDHTLVYAAPLS
ncbi:MAG: hypothetical protein GC164_03330 [Phycisphaera sp.]|nr:hypothetical protein [Phycisphaera sp.]